MRIVETNIPDIDSDNIDFAKVDLANKIIEEVYPLLDNLYQKNIDLSEGMSTELNQKKAKIQKHKNDLEDLIKLYSRKKKVKKLLDRIDKLVSSNIINENYNRQETVVLLKIIDNLKDDKLDYHLKSTMSMLTKRFSGE